MPLPHRLLRSSAATAVATVAAAAVTAGVLAGCGGDSGHRTTTKPSSSAPGTSTTAGVAVREEACRTVISGAPARLDAATTRAIVTLGRNHLHDAVTVPLQSGRVGTDFLAAFNAPAAARVRPGAADRAVLTEADTPLAGTNPAISAVLACTVLTDGTGAPAAASVELRVSARGARGASMRRTGELLLVPAAGTWKISGYDVSVTRDPGTGAPATTTSAVTP